MGIAIDEYKKVKTIQNKNSVNGIKLNVNLMEEDDNFELQQ